MAPIDQFGIRSRILPSELLFSLSTPNKNRTVKIDVSFHEGEKRRNEKMHLQVLGVRRHAAGENQLANNDHYKCDPTFSIVGRATTESRKEPFLVSGWTADGSCLPTCGKAGALKVVTDVDPFIFTDAPSDEAIAQGWVWLAKTENGPNMLGLLLGLFDDTAEHPRNVQFVFNARGAEFKPHLSVQALIHDVDRVVALLKDNRGHMYNVAYDHQKRTGSGAIPTRPL